MNGRFLKILSLKIHVFNRPLPGHTKSEDQERNVVALGEMVHQAAELFEPKASFRLSRNEP